MAKLLGPLQLKGRIGNLSFFPTRNGDIIARTTGGPKKGRVTSDQRFARTLENSREFGRAQRHSHLLSRAFTPLVAQARDGRALRRLHSVALQIVKTDSTNARGERTISAGQLALFEGFDFNAAQPLTTTLRLPFLPSIDRTSGTMDIVFPSFIPAFRVAQAPGASHFRLTAAGGAVDFEASSFETATAASVLLAAESQTPTAPVLSLGIAAGGSQPLFLLLGISFYETAIDGCIRPLKRNEYNTLSIVKVDY